MFSVSAPPKPQTPGPSRPAPQAPHEGRPGKIQGLATAALPARRFHLREVVESFLGQPRLAHFTAVLDTPPQSTAVWRGVLYPWRHPKRPPPVVRSIPQLL